ncbi:MAG: hypothetical protein AABX54_03220 [Nanoarchaeota archaeon]
MTLENLQYVSILVELIVAILGLLIVFKKKKKYGYGIFLTFAIYVFYDLVKLVDYSVSTDILYVLFFIAAASALWTIWMIYKEKDNSKNNTKNNKRRRK